MAPRKKKPQRAHYFYRVTIIPSTFNRQKYLPPARQTWSNISVQTAASVLIQSCCRRSQKVKMGADKNFLNQYLVSRCGSNTFAQKRLAENISRLHKESWGVPGCWIDALGGSSLFHLHRPPPPRVSLYLGNWALRRAAVAPKEDVPFNRRLPWWTARRNYLSS